MNLCLANSKDSYLCFWLILLHSVSYYFFLYQSPSLSLCTNVDGFSHLLMHLSSDTLNVYHKEWLTYSAGTDRSGELCFYFFISNDLTQMVTFQLGCLTMALSQSCSFESVYILCHKYLFYSGYCSIGKV